MVRQTQAWLDNYVANGGKVASGHQAKAPKPPPGITGIGQPPTPRGMNKTEARYAAEILEPAYRAEEILFYKFEGIRIKIGQHKRQAKYYKPDFVVMRADRVIEIHETKGEHITRAGQDNFSAAVEAMPIYVYKMIQYANGTWQLIREHN